jgi:alpha-amylase/alpha-mannosidase (GH57 family)
MKHLHICFLWHMHQPYYTDPVSRSATMPWVRLHATKAYYDMAYLLEQYPAVHASVNFTPSLLRQLQEIGGETVRDLFLEHAQRPAGDLTPEEKTFVIRYFFSANWATMVRPYPRYHELLVKRGLRISAQDLQRVAGLYSTQELLDLQVWHNLAWFGYGTVRRYPRLAELRGKNQGFTEDEKHEVLALQRTAVQEIIPSYRRLLEQGQVELTTTPFFHPIVPLLIDTETTRRARPDLPLPSRLRAPEDAERQLQQAVRFHTDTFGQAPRGLWPSEGAVCPELLPLVHRAGLRWLATDEGILARSLHLSGRPWHRPSDLYQPYRAGDPGLDATIVFRDRDLSDAFGFVYHKTTPESSAEDVLKRLREVIAQSPQDRLMIAIILDGENPWEHYHDGGERMLSLLYEQLTRHCLVQNSSDRMHASTISEALADLSPPHHLHTLHSGSWINQDFQIWIGHPEDNQGWDLLGTTRAKLVDIGPTLPPAQADAAWDELYAAEGSDWFWWYGDEFDTDFKLEFDRLFRTHLRNVWMHMGLMPPDRLGQPICARAAHLEADAVRQPHALITVSVDGLVTDFFEWRGAGSIRTQPPLGAMWKADVIFTAIRFGWSHEHVYFRLDIGEISPDRQARLHVNMTFRGSRQTSRLTFPLADSGLEQFKLFQSNGPDRWQEIGTYRSICRKKIVELGLPWKDLHLEPGEEVHLSILVTEQGLEVARYPHEQPAVLTMPGPDFEAALWRV